MVTVMKMRSLLIGAAASLALGATANATHMDGWYISLEGGGNWIEDADLAIDGPPTNDLATFDTGWAALGSVGYQWNSWRGELEFGYRANDIDAFNAPPDDGEFNEFSAMFNILYDWWFTEKIGLFVGAGAGGDFIEYEDNTAHGAANAIQDDDWVFAWQALGGINYQLTSKTDLFVAYRYFNADGPTFVRAGTVHNDAYDDVVKHTATIGLRYHFGAPAAEPMTAPPPPPPPSDAAAPREFIVFFGHNRSDLTGEAMTVIKQAAAAAKEYGSATVTVVGHADRSGGNAHNQKLSLRRANVVKGALVNEGIAAGSISVSGRGEAEPLVQTNDGAREPQNRRVHINL